MARVSRWSQLYRERLIRPLPFRYKCEYAIGVCQKETVARVEKLMEENNTKIKERKVVEPARKIGKEAFTEGKSYKGVSCGAAIELKDGKLITALNSELMHAASALIIKALKSLINIPDIIPLIHIDFLKYESSKILCNSLLIL